MTNNRFKAALLLFIISLGACNKNEEADLDFTTDEEMATVFFDETQTIADMGFEGNITIGKTVGIMGGCATISHDTTTSPRTILIDFGQTNCLGNDGKYRKGQILCTYTGEYKAPGTVITIGFNNYYVNDNQITGTKITENWGYDSPGRPRWKVNVNGNIILANNKGNIVHNSEHIRTMTAGYTTKVFTDDDYEVEIVTASGTNRKGLSYTTITTSNLAIHYGCKYIVAGTIEITPQGKPTRIIDFGNGACDNQAQLTVGNNTKTITLKR
jgi:hypothetical protein